MEAMKFRRKGDVVSWSNFFRCTIFIVVSCFTFSAVRLFFAGGHFFFLLGNFQFYHF